MLIPDLLNALFDQSDYQALTTLRSLDKRKTKYANKYSLLSHYFIGMVKNINLNDVCEHGFLKCMTNLTCVNMNTEYVLCSCILNGHLELVKYVVDAGANVHAKNNIALLWSVEYGHLEIIKYLISVGADIHARDEFALRWSAECMNLNLVKYLVCVGANIHVDNNELFSIKMIKDNFSY